MKNRLTNLSDSLKQEKENNDDLENILKQKDEEIDPIEMDVKAKVAEWEHLEVFTQDNSGIETNIHLHLYIQ